MCTCWRIVWPLACLHTASVIASHQYFMMYIGSSMRIKHRGVCSSMEVECLQTLKKCINAIRFSFFLQNVPASFSYILLLLMYRASLDIWDKNDGSKEKKSQIGSRDISFDTLLLCYLGRVYIKLYFTSKLSIGLVLFYESLWWFPWDEGIWIKNVWTTPYFLQNLNRV